MDQEDIFSSLPPEIILNILSRIPFKTVFACKCVCKSWLDLLRTPNFALSHLSKSVPGLLAHRSTYINFSKTNIFKIFESEDSLAIECSDLRYKIVLELDVEKHFNFSYGSRTFIEGSANGLLLFQKPSDLYVCNPITRECIKLPELEGLIYDGGMVIYGFGVSRLTNRYKAVRIFHDCIYDPDNTRSMESVCQVYALGTGSWRVVAPPCETLIDYGGQEEISKFLNGNLHWLARDSTDTWWISCFDLETEVFSKFRAPMVESGRSCLTVGVLRDCLCLCDSSSESEICIYLLNDYGDEKKSWNKEYVISKGPHFFVEGCDVVYVVKDFADGDLIMAAPYIPFICYSNRTKTLELVDIIDVGDTRFGKTILYTPSFISLKDFEAENAELL